MQEHITEKLSAYLHHELSKEERQQVSEHLLQCENCRSAHDRIRLGAALAATLERADAPDAVWRRIENALDPKTPAQIAQVPYFSLFNRRALFAAAALLIAFGLVSAVYLGFYRGHTKEIVESKPTPNQTAVVETAQIATTPAESVPHQTIEAPDQNAGAQTSASENSNVPAAAPLKNSNVRTAPKVNPNDQKTNDPAETIVARSDLPAWNVETISGAPRTGNLTIAGNGKLVVGEFLETDANSSARVQVANIGQVEIRPNSRVRLVETKSTEHRLSLERGTLQAKILAPPRLFIVDTPSAVAVDLGCEYTLEVDADGNSRLHVTSGYVALERGGLESIVPAGAICLTKRGKGIGTPFSEDASSEFQNALVRFDFQNGGSQSVRTIVKESAFYDTLSLFHLLSRTGGGDREKIFDALSKYVKPPVGTTRAGILRLDKKMLAQWWAEIESIWFE